MSLSASSAQLQALSLSRVLLSALHALMLSFFCPCRARHGEDPPVLVDNVRQYVQAVWALRKQDQVAVDIEGVELGRRGQICLIQMCGPSTPVYVFDICALENIGVRLISLSNILESEEITKIFYDVRSDADALFHLLQVTLRCAYDIQVLWHTLHQHENDTRLDSFTKVLGVFLNPRERERQMALKEQGRRLFMNNTELWKVRPLSDILIEYAAMDVKYLLQMRRRWTLGAFPENRDRRVVLDEFVFDATARRLNHRVDLNDADFDMLQTESFKVDWNRCGSEEYRDLSIVWREVLIPEPLMGTVIGKGGRHIQRIQETSGAKVVLSGERADLFGQTAQVTSAERQIRDILGRQRREAPAAKPATKMTNAKSQERSGR